MDSDDDGIVGLLDNCPLMANPNQEDLDWDGVGNISDADRDNDGVLNGVDTDLNHNKVCRDIDLDMCDDCSVSVDGFGSQADAQIDNDSTAFDGDGLCDLGDNDDDGVDNPVDNCPFRANPDQVASNANGVGDACDINETLCTVFRALNVNFLVICPLIARRNPKHRLTKINQSLNYLVYGSLG
jgi:hypothetical protein